MAKRKVSMWAIPWLFSALALPVAARADPITVMGGELVVTGLTGSLQLFGERGFSLMAGVSTASGIFQPYQCRSAPECHPGTVVSLDAFWSGLDIRGGVLTFDGQTHSVQENGGASVAVAFSGSFIAPPLASSAVVTAPFHLVPPGGPSSLGSSFTLPFPMNSVTFLTGTGMATVNLSPWGAAFPDAWSVASVRYDFSPSEPVPEPGTMVMVGLGIAGVARRMKMARARSR